MKLYTRNEIKLMLENMGTYTEESVEYFLDELTPIEIPSNEELTIEIKNRYETPHYNHGFMDAFYWVIDNIKNQQ